MKQQSKYFQPGPTHAWSTAAYPRPRTDSSGRIRGPRAYVLTASQAEQCKSNALFIVVVSTFDVDGFTKGKYGGVPLRHVLFIPRGREMTAVVS